MTPRTTATATTTGWSRARWVLLVALLMVGMATVPTERAEAFPADITVLGVQPVVDGTLFVSRTAANNPLDPPTFQLKGEVRLQNNGSQPAQVTGVTISYPGSSISPSPTLGFFDDSDRTIEPFPLGEGERNPDSVRFWDGLERDLPTPLPPTVQIDLEMDNDPVPLTLTYDLAFRDNAVDLGAHFFPAKADDLGPGEYWWWQTRHAVDSGGGEGPINPSRGSSRYALDISVVAWDAEAEVYRSTYSTSRSQNDDFRVYEKPLYSMGDGTIIACYRGEPDEPPLKSDEDFDDREFYNGAGNSLVMRYGDDKVTLAHLKPGSIPEELCPTPSSPGPGLFPHKDMQTGLSIPVSTGQFLGKVGNTGRSSEPHLHFEAAHVPDSGPNTVSGVPMQFLNVRAVADDNYITSLGATPTLRPLHGMTLHRNSLVLPNPCGFEHLPEEGLTEYSVHGISAECYQDTFHLITSRGYRPVFVDGYDVAGDTFFNATFRHPGPASHARHGLTEAEYEGLLVDRADDGYRLHQVDSYRSAGAVRYAAIFEKRPGPKFEEFHGLDDTAFGNRLDALMADGFVPVNVSAVEVGGQLQWSGLFEQVAATGWSIHPVSPGDYQDVFNDNIDAGRVLTYVNGLTTAGGPMLIAVFVDPIGPNWRATHGLTAGQFQVTFDSNMDAGRFTRYTTGYDEGGQASFAAVWRGRPDTSFTRTPGPITNQPAARFEFAASNPFTTLECSLDGAAFSPCASPVTLAGLGEGYHTYQARATDREQLRDLSPATFTWLVDLTPPEAAIVAPEKDTKTVHGQPKDDEVEATTVVGWADVVAEASDALSGIDTVVFHVDGMPVPAAEVTQPTPGAWSFRFEPDKKGEHGYTISVTATDVAGNSTTDTLTIVATTTGKPQP